MNKYSDWSPFILRVITGVGFVVHGWAKISRGTAGFEKMLLQLNIPLASIMSHVVPYIELLGGIALIVGFLVRGVTIPLIVTMLAAMFTIHIRYGFSSIKTIGLNADGPLFGPPGYEVNLLYIAVLVSLLITGAGKLSFDEIYTKRKKHNNGRSARNTGKD
jgi:putative oxidoreductase